MDIFELYSSGKHSELKDIFLIGAQQHPANVAQNFLEKDVWITEVLRLLYDEKILGRSAVAFKGGTALSKCWGCIERFSEDIDLSIHWADLAAVNPDEINEAWNKSTQSRSQRDKFRSKQQEYLEEWLVSFVDTLNLRLSDYGIDGLRAEIEDGREGKVDIHFPRLTSNSNTYQLDHILLEFGGRNRGRPTESHGVSCYLSEVDDLKSLGFPEATVDAYRTSYILWEKLTALHQFSTQSKDLNSSRLARHWYDVDCLLNSESFKSGLFDDDALRDVVEMKSGRFSMRGVDYNQVLAGHLQLIPEESRLLAIEKDHQDAIDGGMFFGSPAGFDEIIDRIRNIQDVFNRHRQSDN